jgi:hypothetical protein
MAVPNAACSVDCIGWSLCEALIAAPITDEVSVPATTTRSALLRRVVTRSATLLAAATLVTACANPTGPVDMSTKAPTSAVSGVIIGSSSTAAPTANKSGVIIGSSS